MAAGVIPTVCSGCDLAQRSAPPSQAEHFSQLSAPRGEVENTSPGVPVLCLSFLQNAPGKQEGGV